MPKGKVADIVQLIDSVVQLIHFLAIEKFVNFWIDYWAMEDKPKALEIHEQVQNNEASSTPSGVQMTGEVTVNEPASTVVGTPQGTTGGVV